MKYPSYLLLLIVTVLSFNRAHAETFTYESSRDEATVVGGIGPDGNYVGAFWTGKGTQTYVDGKTTKNTSTCVSMKQPPRDSVFTSHVACEVSSPEEGVISLAYGCVVINEETNEMSCIGAITGKSGKRKGASGNVTSHVKGGVSKGTGQWFE